MNVCCRYLTHMKKNQARNHVSITAEASHDKHVYFIITHKESHRNELYNILTAARRVRNGLPELTVNLIIQRSACVAVTELDRRILAKIHQLDVRIYLTFDQLDDKLYEDVSFSDVQLRDVTHSCRALVLSPDQVLDLSDLNVLAEFFAL